MATNDLETIRFGFDVREAVGIDRRLVLTKEEMRLGIVYWDGEDSPIVLDNILPDNYLAVCSDDNNVYVYYKNVDPCIDLRCKCCGNLWVGKFKLVTKVIEVLDYDTAESLVDSEGYVSIYDANGAIQRKLEHDVYSTTDSEAVMYRLNDQENRKADKTWVSEQVRHQTLRKNNRIAIYGDADKITGYDSEGDPIIVERGNEYDPDTGELTFDGAGVHVKYDKTDFKADPENNPIKVQITNDDIVGGDGWTAVYECGGVAEGRYFDRNTTIKEVVRLMLIGDPQYEGIIYYGALEELPSTENEIGRMSFQVITYDQMFPSDVTDATYVYETMKPIDFYDKYWMIAMPGKTWDRAKNGKKHFVNLSEMWEHTTPAFTYEMKSIVLPGEGDFKVWYNPVKGATHDKVQNDVKFKLGITKE